MKLNKKPESLIEKPANLLLRQKEFLEQLGQGMVEEVKRRLEKTKADPDGRKWKPWATSTAQARRKAGTAGTGLLISSGRLRDSIEYQVQGPKVVVRTYVPYAQYLQNGTNRMPARPFLGTGKREEALMKNIWKKWIG